MEGGVSTDIFCLFRLLGGQLCLSFPRIPALTCFRARAHVLECGYFVIRNCGESTRYTVDFFLMELGDFAVNNRPTVLPRGLVVKKLRLILSFKLNKGI